MTCDELADNAIGNVPDVYCNDHDIYIRIPEGSFPLGRSGAERDATLACSAITAPD